MSYKIVIADDEPLVLIGLGSLLDYKAEGFEIIGQARNGAILQDTIEKLHPDIVITDIKMPIKSGLEVMKAVKDSVNPPVFILLTSFEEFAFVKEALSLGAVDYLVKLELTKENLLAALTKAKEKVDSLKKASVNTKENTVKNLLKERFFIRQFFLLGDNSTPLSEQISNLGLDLDYSSFAVCYIEFPEILEMNNKDRAISMYSYASSMVEETLSRYMQAYTTRLDLGHIAITLCFEKNKESGYRSFALSALKAVKDNINSFFSQSLLISVGPLVGSIRLLSESFSKAQGIAERANVQNPIIFFDYAECRNEKEEIILDFSTYHEKLKKAFSELDSNALMEGIKDITEAMNNSNLSRERAIDITSNILYMVMTLIPDGEKMVEDIFPLQKGGYHILYQLRNTAECITWLNQLAEGITKALTDRKQDYRIKVINKKKSYAEEKNWA